MKKKKKEKPTIDIGTAFEVLLYKDDIMVGFGRIMIMPDGEYQVIDMYDLKGEPYTGESGLYTISSPGEARPLVIPKNIQ